MDKFTQQYNIDRRAASKLLKVSVRTVDRYIKKKVLAAQNVGGRVWLDKEDVIKLSGNRFQPPDSFMTQPGYSPGSFVGEKYPTIDSEIDTSTPVMSIDIVGDKFGQKDEQMSTSISSQNVKGAYNSQLYQKLYEDTKGELNEKIERLEIANYRVGQLEAQLKNTIPLLEYHREASEKKMEKAHLLEKIDHAETTVRALSQKISFERYNKKVVFTILLIILALQPLWLLLLQK